MLAVALTAEQCCSVESYLQILQMLDLLMFAQRRSAYSQQINVIDYTKQMHLSGVNYQIGYLADTLMYKK
jgi:hypothetical protein